MAAATAAPTVEGEVPEAELLLLFPDGLPLQLPPDLPSALMQLWDLQLGRLTSKRSQSLAAQMMQACGVGGGAGRVTAAPAREGRVTAAVLRLQPQPSTLHPAPCTLQPQPYTLHPQP